MLVACGAPGAECTQVAGAPVDQEQVSCVSLGEWRMALVGERIMVAGE